MIVWEEYALQLDDAIEKNHFVRKSLVVMLTLANIKDPKGHSNGLFYSFHICFNLLYECILHVTIILFAEVVCQH